MTFSELARGGPIQAVIDGCGESAEIGLYRPNIDPFEEDEILDWPDDWPSWISTKFLKDLGIEVIVA